MTLGADSDVRYILIRSELLVNSQTDVTPNVACKEQELIPIEIEVWGQEQIVRSFDGRPDG